MFETRPKNRRLSEAWTIMSVANPLGERNCLRFDPDQVIADIVTCLTSGTRRGSVSSITGGWIVTLDIGAMLWQRRKLRGRANLFYYLLLRISSGRASFIICCEVGFSIPKRQFSFGLSIDEVCCGGTVQGRRSPFQVAFRSSPLLLLAPVAKRMGPRANTTQRSMCW